MQTIHLQKAGLAVGGLMGSWHLFWALLVALGLAQPIIDFVFWMHFIKPVYVIGPFNIGTALVLVGATSLVGYAMGVIFAGIWNFLQR
jgi:hypothetical protein